MSGELDYDAERARIIARRRAVAIAVALVAIAAAVVAVFLFAGGPDPEPPLDDFLAAYETRDYEAAAALTDGDPEKVARALEANVEGLDGAELSAETISVEADGDDARAETEMSWQIPGIGDFSYVNARVRMVRPDDEWRVRWSDDVVHPALDDGGERLGTERIPAERAPILDRDGRALVQPRPVVEVGVVAGELSQAKVDRAVEAVAANTETDERALRRSLGAASSPDNFVPAITLRADEFAAVEQKLEPVAGIEFGQRELPLAPTKEFARALLGTVAPATAEQLSELGDPYVVGDNVGQFGLQAEHEGRLAGKPDRSVIVRDSEGAPVKTLFELEGERGKPLRTTLDPRVQEAAERALGDTTDVTALVAVQPSSGDVLASASRPIDDAFNRAFEGQYPPGSTFKVVTTTALLANGLDPGETVDCPPTITVGGRSFRNFEGSAAGAVPFRTDFAESCNTAFISLADRLGPEDLRAAGATLGLGRSYEIGVPAFSGDVPVIRDEVEMAASMIGQGEILASPLAMAGVAAAVADGRWRAPRVLASDPHEAGDPLDSAQLAELRSLMRDVVTSGTGTALADVPGEPIGKSGTAEYGSGDPPPTHAWFIAATDEVAVAVLAEDEPSGGEFAAPIAARFLGGL
jgi:cell division protein FtsI/penicillin-binding protein 2